MNDRMKMITSLVVIILVSIAIRAITCNIVALFSDYRQYIGIVVSENNWSLVGNHTIEINTNELPNGIYFYRADIDKLYTGKIIKTQ